MSNILVLHGPNLNLLGQRELETYGSTTLAEIDQALEQRASKAGHQFSSVQSNAEAELVAQIQQASGLQDFIIFNPAALTHTSVALRDALLAVAIPFIEVHLSNIHSREAFRQQSYLSDIAVGVISGLGVDIYLLAMDAAINRLAKPG